MGLEAGLLHLLLFTHTYNKDFPSFLSILYLVSREIGASRQQISVYVVLGASFLLWRTLVFNSVLGEYWPWNLLS